jgi:hypothetical protein
MAQTFFDVRRKLDAEGILPSGKITEGDHHANGNANKPRDMMKAGNVSPPKHLPKGPQQIVALVAALPLV